MGTRELTGRELLEWVRTQACVATGRKPVDAAHVRSRGAGGADTWDNVIPLHRDVHREQHARGWPFVLGRYPALGVALRERGWAIGVELGTRRLLRL